MLPFDVPPGTTLESLFTEVIPRAHALMVPAGQQPGPGDRFVAVHSVRGWKTFTFEIRGGRLDVREGHAAQPDFWIHVERDAIQTFLDDWMGDKRLLPKSMPKDLVGITDPRVLKRLALVSGKAELALSNLGGKRVSMTVACGAAAKKPIESDDPDVVLEADAATFLRLVEGTLPPEDAIADGAVVVRGKRMLAMQLAFAFAPFYPKR
jgi:putative sterol carrier protein